MNNEELNIRFETWWNEEAKFITPSSSDWVKTKEIIKTAWLNGAYVANEINLKDKK